MLNPRFLNYAPFTLGGYIKKSFLDREKEGDGIFNFWEKTWGDGSVAKLQEAAKQNSPLQRVVGYAGNADFKSGQYDYGILAELDPSRLDQVRKLFPSTIEIPAYRWAIFEGQGTLPEAIVKLINEVWQVWEPANKLALPAAPMLEIYYPGDPTSPTYKFEIWMAVNKE